MGNVLRTPNYKTNTQQQTDDNVETTNNNERRNRIEGKATALLKKCYKLGIVDDIEKKKKSQQQQNNKKRKHNDITTLPLNEEDEHDNNSNKITCNVVDDEETNNNNNIMTAHRYVSPITKRKKTRHHQHEEEEEDETRNIYQNDGDDNSNNKNRNISSDLGDSFHKEKVEKSSNPDDEIISNDSKSDNPSDNAKQINTNTNAEASSKKIDILFNKIQEYQGARVGVFVRDPNGVETEDIWLPGKIISVEKDYESESELLETETVFVKVKTIDNQIGHVEFNTSLVHDQTVKFPTDDFRLLVEDKDGTAYLHGPGNKQIEFYKCNPSKLRKNNIVYAKWGKTGAMYRGKILSISSSSSCQVLYDDGDIKTFYSSKQQQQHGSGGGGCHYYKDIWLANKNIDKPPPRPKKRIRRNST